jgi:hypothetical protein
MMLAVSLTGSKNRKNGKRRSVDTKEEGGRFLGSGGGAVFDRKVGTDHMTTGCKGCQKQRQRPPKTASYVPESRVVL